METVKIITIQLDDIRLQVENDEVEQPILFTLAEIYQHNFERNRDAMAKLQLDMLFYGTGAYTLEPDDDGIKMTNIHPSELLELNYGQ